jgi:hypothetical protein
MYKNMNLDRPLLEGPWSKHHVFMDMEVMMTVSGLFFPFYAHLECWKLLDAQYPGSKFILNTRDIEGWIRSRKIHYGQYGGLLKRLADHYKTDDLEGLWVRQRERHHNEVIKYFSERDDLLVFDIEKDSTEKLRSFLPEYNLTRRELPKIK